MYYLRLTMAWIRHNPHVFNHGEIKKWQALHFINFKLACLSTLIIFIYRLQYKYLDLIHLGKLLYTL